MCLQMLPTTPAVEASTPMSEESAAALPAADGKAEVAELPDAAPDPADSLLALMSLLDLGANLANLDTPPASLSVTATPAPFLPQSVGQPAAAVASTARPAVSREDSFRSTVSKEAPFRSEPTATVTATIAELAIISGAEVFTLASATPAQEVTSPPAEAIEISFMPPMATTPRATEVAPILAMKDGPPSAFAEHFNEQVTWQVGQRLQEARIQLHPQELGAVDIQLKLDGEKASLVFTVEQLPARAAVQAALPQLTVLLAGQGIQLADAQVQSQHQGHAPRTALPAPTDAGDAADEPVPQATRQRVGLIDHYA